jgi:hypothetical protein
VGCLQKKTEEGKNAVEFAWCSLPFFFFFVRLKSQTLSLTPAGGTKEGESIGRTDVSWGESPETDNCGHTLFSSDAKSHTLFSSDAKSQRPAFALVAVHFCVILCMHFRWSCRPVLAESWKRVQLHKLACCSTCTGHGEFDGCGDKMKQFSHLFPFMRTLPSLSDSRKQRSLEWKQEGEAIAPIGKQIS